MSIKFFCSCGKNLRARDEMAGRRSMCPRCGAPVGIPSLRPTHRGTIAAPLTAEERRWRNRHAPPPEDPFTAETALITALPPKLPLGGASGVATGVGPPRPERRPRQMEMHWYQCLAYPFFCARVLALLAAALTLLSSCLALLAPELPHFAGMTLRERLPYAAGLLPPLLALAYACATVDCALASALAGRGPGAYWPGWQVGAALRSTMRWLACFLAGPIAPATLASYYWLNGGDLAVLDWLILGELAVLTISYWLLAVVSCADSGRIRDINPTQVFRLLHRLGIRAAVPVLVVPALAFAHLLMAFFAFGELHRHPFLGALLLALTWGGALFSGTALFRLLGVWCYHEDPSYFPASSFGAGSTAAVRSARLGRDGKGTCGSV